MSRAPRWRSAWLRLPGPVRRRVRRLRDLAYRPVENWGSSASAPRRFGDAPSVGAVLAVYRERNAGILAGVLSGRPAGWMVRLWALDHAHPGLAGYTVGEGPGDRLALLNRLYSTLPSSFSGWVVLSDDDYVFSRGSLATAVGVAAAGGVGLSGVAHDHRSHASHSITLGRALSIARLTTFVEVGPVVIVAPQWRRRVLPLPEQFVHGHGLEAAWFHLKGEGCRLGLVDAALIRHLVPPTPWLGESGVRHLHSELDAQGGYHAAVRTLDTWRPWRRVPPWRENGSQHQSRAGKPVT